MLGNTLVTIQTGEHGKQVNRLYVTDGVDIAKEYYLALLVDRGSGRIDRDRGDPLRRVMGDRLDVHDALGRGDHRDAAAPADDAQGERIFPG